MGPSLSDIRKEKELDVSPIDIDGDVFIPTVEPPSDEQLAQFIAPTGISEVFARGKKRRTAGEGVPLSSSFVQNKIRQKNTGRTTKEGTGNTGKPGEDQPPETELIEGRRRLRKLLNKEKGVSDILYGKGFEFEPAPIGIPSFE